jgi:acetoin utilization protein AcuB
VTDVGNYMTKSSHTIDVEQTLSVARRFMSEHRLRHLPVLHGGMLVGMLSARDLEAFEILPGSRHLTVEEAMVPNPYVTSEDAPLDEVAEEMARRNAGSAVVVAASEATKVLGVFAAAEAFRALADALRSSAAAP